MRIDNRMLRLTCAKSYDRCRNYRWNLWTDHGRDTRAITERIMTPPGPSDSRGAGVGKWTHSKWIITDSTVALRPPQVVLTGATLREEMRNNRVSPRRGSYGAALPQQPLSIEMTDMARHDLEAWITQLA